ncbi:hypothetical protein [Achromobacter xylosoxidans]|jgi:hypothetical protein|uniref:hypothetical protein n=1 Tax=Alcaligenes xylosoxydans xylosoxydans TaxID=85698 RepID=UPI0006C1C3A6|nr:hypothetical protein [Achromobacter xylosoxidans]CUJ47367.1 Uncharacterised protein [Achromobacter xylosoxidans]
MRIESGEYEEVGFIKYSGDPLRAGVIDARSAGSALLGLDEAIRFFNMQQSAELAEVEYDVPVQTRTGSWEAVLLAGGAVATAFALGYVKKAGEKMAENDFKEIGLKNVLSRSMSAIVTLVRLIKHTEKSCDWTTKRIEPSFSGSTVIVADEVGREIAVPVDFYRWYQKTPPGLLSKMTSVIREDRPLTIGSYESDEMNSVLLVASEKALFESRDSDGDDGDILFPELKHGDYVALEGRLIRGSEKSNAVGLEYQGHVINCMPSSGSIRKYKSALFLRCRVEGMIIRHSKNSYVAERRPKIIIDRVIPLQPDQQGILFER